MKIKYFVLFLFIFSEVYFFESKSNFQIISSVCFYLYLIVLAVINFRKSVEYYFYFSLLTMGAWSYISPLNIPQNFWGLKLQGISINVLFSFFLLIGGIILKKGKFLINKPSIFFLVYIFYSAIIGYLYVLKGQNYLDNFISDLFVLLPSISYIFLFSFFSRNELLGIFKNCYIFSIISIILSWILDKNFIYGFSYKYLLMNGMSFILPYAFLFISGIFNKKLQIINGILILIFIYLGKLFISGKLIVLLTCAIFVSLLVNYSKGAILFITSIIISYFIFFNTEFFGNFSEDSLMAHKLNQIFDVFSIFDIEFLASSPTSMGNIIAEGVTIFNHYFSNWKFFIFGKGFGGGIPDLFGYLTPLSNPTQGYKEIDASRNNFFRMHLPIYEIFIKTGLIGLSCFFGLIFYIIKSNSKFTFLIFSLLFLVVFNTKEMLLLTILLFNLLEYKRTDFESK